MPGKGFTFSAAIACAVSASASVDLSYRWVEGQAITYRITKTDSATIAGIAGMPPLEQSNKQVSTVRITPAGADEDGATKLQVVFEAISLELTGRGGTRSYDSADPGPNAEHNPLAGPVTAVVGQPFTVVLGPDGSVRSIDGIGPIIDRMDEVSAGREVRSAFGDRAFRALFEVAFHHLPARAAEVGDAWDITLRTPMPGGEFSVRSHCTLSGADGDDAVIQTRRDVEFEPSADAADPMARTMRSMKVTDSEGSGTVLFDARRGLLLRFEGRSSVTMEQTSKGPDGADMTITFTHKDTTTTELIEDGRAHP